MSEQAKCELCGEPMPPGEEVFKYHGYSGPCPKPPLKRETYSARDFIERFRKFAPDCAQLLDGWHLDGTAWSEWDKKVRQELSELQKMAETICNQ